MRHGYAGRKLKRTASHRKALLSNLATSLFEHKRVRTTVAKAKELRPFAEQLITRARKAYSAERANNAGGVDVHNRRMVGRFIRNKAVLQELFDTIAPVVAERNGGYTRITKLGQRRGDQSPEAIIELVDWSNAQDGRVSSKGGRKAKAVKPAKPAKPAGAEALTATAAAGAVATAAEPVAESAADAAAEQEVAQVTETTVDAVVEEQAEAVVPEAEAVQGDAPLADDASEAGNAPAGDEEKSE